MATHAFAAPVLDGTIDDYRTFVDTLAGARREEAEATRRTAGLDREQVFLQMTPMGHLAVIVWETNDFQKAVHAIAADPSDFGAWFRSSLQRFHGIDIASQEMPSPTLVDEWKDDSWRHGLDSWAFAFPLKDVPAAKGFVAELLGPRREEFASTRRAFGVKRASFFLFETPNGSMAVQYVQGDPLSFPKALQATATSEEPLYAWWREQVQSFAAVPMFQDGGKGLQVEELMDLQVRVPAKA